MTFWGDVAADGASAWFDSDGLAREATYKAGGTGEGTSCSVVLDYGAQPEVERSPVNQGRGVRYLYDQATAVIESSAAASPAYGDTLEVAGTVWTVREVLGGNGVHWRLKLQYNAKASH